MAQAVERWHSVRASQFRILEQYLAFFGNAISLFLLGIGLPLKRTGHQKCLIPFLLLYCFLSLKHCEYINCIIPMNQRKEKINPQKRPGKTQIKKQTQFLTLATLGRFHELSSVVASWLEGKGFVSGCR